MTDAPERIWLQAYGQYSSERLDDNTDKDEYRRADLPPTLAEAMKVPEVRALVKALKKAEAGLSAGCDKYCERTIQGAEVPGDEQYPWVRLMQIGRDASRAALAKLAEGAPE